MLAVALTAASALVVPMPVRLQPAHVPLARLGFPAMQAPAAAYSPAKEVSARGGKYYEGRTPEMSKAIKQALKEVGTRKICVVTGASSGLGLSCVQSLLRDYEGYYVIAAVRDPEKMDQEAAKLGIDPKDYQAMKLECASLQSVKDFVQDLKKVLPRGRGLDRLVCNAAVYLPTDPKPRFTDDGYEMSFGVNHLSHFLLLQLLIPELKKAKDPRVCIVGSVTGNKNTIAGSLVKPIADVGDFSGLRTGPGAVMVDGSSQFDGAKAYKDAKALNMMTVLEAHRRLHKDTGIIFNSMYPGCIAQTQLFREKRDWFRYFFFPTLMKAIGSYVSQPEAGQRLAQVCTAGAHPLDQLVTCLDSPESGSEVIADPIAAKSGVYWSWNGDAKYFGVGNAGGAGGEIFENDFSGMVQDEGNGKLCWDLSLKLVKPYLQENIWDLF